MRRHRYNSAATSRTSQLTKVNREWGHPVLCRHTHVRRRPRFGIHCRHWHSGRDPVYWGEKLAGRHVGEKPGLLRLPGRWRIVQLAIRAPQRS